mgnify:CR=1 FL=1
MFYAIADVIEKYLGMRKYPDEVPIQNLQVAPRKTSINSDLIELCA